MKTKRNDDWMEQAEKLGQQLAEGLERFGDRVAKAIETIEAKVGPQIKKAAQGMGVDDQRIPVGEAGPVEQVARGDVFDLQNELFMRLGNVPGAPDDELVNAVHLSSGEVRRFERGIEVLSVDATLVVKPPSNPPPAE
ncbi:MAG: hypothetical protein AAF449_24585 [Myxococcota bacterium]